MKVLVHDEAFLDHLKHVVSKDSPDKLRLGVIIGAPHVKQTVAVYVAMCPPPEGSGDGISSSMITEQALLVARLSPGGVDVLGVAAIGRSHLLEQKKSEVKQALVVAHKALAQTPQMVDYPQRVLLHVEPTTLKMTSRLIDMTNPSGNGMPQDIKLVKNCTAFTEISCQLVLQSLGHISEEVAGRALRWQMAAYTAELEATLDTSEILIGGQRCDSNVPLAAQLETVSEDHADPVEFVLKQSGPSRRNPAEPVEVSLSGAGAHVFTRGSMRLRAVLPPRATCADAAAAIRQDARRSLQARCRMHCDDMENMIEDEQLDPLLRHELPKRVFLRSSKAPSGVPFCDYVFHGEEYSLLTFQDVLGLDVDVEDIELNAEESPAGEARDAEEAAQVEEMVEEIIQEGAKQLRKDPAHVVIVLVLSVCVALLAVMLGYVVLRR